MGRRLLLIIAALLVAFAVASAPAHAAPISQKDLTAQAKLLKKALDEYAAGKGWGIEEGTGASFSFDPGGPKPLLAYHLTGPSSTDVRLRTTCYQYDASETAGQAWYVAAVKEAGAQPTKVGPHDAYLAITSNANLEIMTAELVWQCENLSYDLLATVAWNPDPGSGESDTDKLTDAVMNEAAAFHQKLEEAGLCLRGANPFRVTARVVTRTDGKPAFPWRLAVQVEKRKSDGTCEPLKKVVPLYLECSVTPGYAGVSLLDCLTCVQSPKLSGSSTRIFDCYFEGEQYLTDKNGKAELPLYAFRQFLAMEPGAEVPYLDFRLDFSKLANALYNPKGFQREPCMTVQVFAAPAVSPNEMSSTADFTAESAKLDVALNRITDLTEPDIYKGRVTSKTLRGSVIKVKHPWVADGEPGAWQDVAAFPYPLEPGDQMSIEKADVVYLQWVDGSTWLFAANFAANPAPDNRLRFWVAPARVREWADFTKYPEATSPLVDMKSVDPIVAIGWSAVKGTFWSWAVTLVTGSGPGFATRAVIATVELGVGSVLSGTAPVKITRLQSTALYILGKNQEVFLFEGKLAALSGDSEQVTLTSGQKLGYDEAGDANGPTPFSETDLPPGGRDLVSAVRDAAGDAGGETPGEQVTRPASSPGLSGAAWAGIGAGIFVALAIVAVAIALVSRRHAKRARAGGAAEAPAYDAWAGPSGPPWSAELLGPLAGEAAPGSGVDGPAAPSVMADGWYVGLPDRQLGPLAWETLVQMAAMQTITPADAVYHAAYGRWAPASSIPGLFWAETDKGSA
jgi:hypothetical protein